MQTGRMSAVVPRVITYTTTTTKRGREFKATTMYTYIYILQSYYRCPFSQTVEFFPTLLKPRLYLGVLVEYF